MKLSRRELVKIAAAYTFPSFSSFNVFGNALGGENAPRQRNYKALVCVFLYGGNDSWNLFFPVADESSAGAAIGRGYDTFIKQRGNLAAKHHDLTLPNKEDFDRGNLCFLESTKRSKGFFPLDKQWAVSEWAPELALMYKENSLAIIANTGVLAEQVSRSNLSDLNIPYFLFAHNHQQHAINTANGALRENIGWAGRLNDRWSPNKGPITELSVVLDKPTKAAYGKGSSGLILPSAGPMSFPGVLNGGGQLTQYGEAIKKLVEIKSDEPFGSLIADRYEKALQVTKFLHKHWLPEAPWSSLTGPYGEELFSVSGGEVGERCENIDRSLMLRLESTARLIEIGRKTGQNRQVFFLGMGGFDTHANQLNQHPLLLRSLSLSLYHFQKAIDSMGMADQVTLFTQSDFGRTLSMNNDGTDHGWSGNQLVMGGAVNSKVYGEMPDIRENSEQMYPDNRGRIIPDIASELITADLLRWFDAPESAIRSALPLLGRFEKTEKDRLGIMKKTS